MKMHSLGCKTIEDGLITALIFLVASICLVSAGVWIVPEIGYLSQIIILSGILVFLFVPVILMATYLKNQ